MRSYSFFTILLLCFAILVIDVFAFYWLQMVTELITTKALVWVINGAFWIFTIGLISAILLLKIRLDAVNPIKKQLIISSLYGLTISSFIPKIIFVVGSAVLSATNYVFLDSKSLVVVPLLALASGVLPFSVIVFGILKTVYRFKVHTTEVSLPLLPSAFDGFKIVQISDIHIGSFNFRYAILERAVRLINNLEPDIIVFTGDLVNNYAWELRGWETVFNKLKAKNGKYAVLGNHDYGDYSSWDSKAAKQENFLAIKNFFAKTNFTLLLNEGRFIEKQTDKLAILGVENWGMPPFKQYGNLGEALKEVSEVSIKILLSHDPSHWSQEVVPKTDIALTLSGHTHGMQAGINVGTKKWSPIQYKFKHWAGLYKEGNQYLHVNRGLGWLGFPGRIGMRPEITCITLRKHGRKH
ncbi:metallophosphoesterase [Bizionia sediminis]|uniref:Metallophosphoesterase n=1 Tax=Bizionia sediminis TaxID=1737064 RepID=A0ABW5KY32_9FLAO